MPQYPKIRILNRPNPLTTPETIITTPTIATTPPTESFPMSDRSPEEPPDVELQLQRLLERSGAVGVDYIPQLQHHPTLYRSPYHLPE